MAELAPSDVYPVLRRFLEETGFGKTLKSFDKETAPEDEEAAPTKAKRKLAKKLAKCEILAAVNAWLQDGTEVEASDIYPVLRRFLVETSLQKTLKGFDKETATEEEAAPTKAKKKLAKKLASCEILAAVQAFLDGGAATTEAPAAEAAAEATPATPRKRAKSDASETGKKKKRKLSEAAAAAPAAEEAAEEAPKKKRKASKDLSEAKTNKAEPEAVKEAPKKAEKAKKTPGTPFSRIDHDKWVAVAAKQDKRLLDNTHEGKEKYGIQGDSWGDQASADLLKVKGKGFRKEMQKKKRASWRGGGEISQVTNSIAFADSDDE